MAINYHFSDSNIQTVYVTQGAEIGTLMTGPTKTEIVNGGEVTRSFYGWTRYNGSELGIVDENYVVNSSIDLYPLFDYVVTFKNGSEVLERRVVKRHEMLGEVPVVESANDEHKVWRYTKNNYTKYYDANTPITEDVVVVPATDLEIVFDLNGSGEIIDSTKFYVSTVWGQDTWGDLIDNAPIPDAEGYLNLKTNTDTYVTHENPDFFHTGKIFLGWYTAAEGGSKITEKTRTAARTDKVFYAHWKDNIEFDIYGLTPDGQQKVGKAKLLDERYGDCNVAAVNLNHYNDGQSSTYIHKSIPKTDFFSDDFNYIPLFYVDESLTDQEYNTPWYYKWQGFLDEPQIFVEMQATNLYRAANGRYYRYKITKTRPAYWLTINLKEGGSSSNNITNLNKSDFTWDANTNFDKMFDFAAGQVKILSSYDSTHGISKNIPYFDNNGNVIDRDTKWETQSDTTSTYIPNLYFSSLKRTKDGQCWKSWSKNNSTTTSVAAITNDSATTYLGANWMDMWVASSSNAISLPTGDNKTWEWSIQNYAKRYPTSTSRSLCAAFHRISPHHYLVQGVRRDDNTTETLNNGNYIYNTTIDSAEAIGSSSYTINNLKDYSQLILTAYNENGDIYNSFTKNIYLYFIKYRYYTTQDYSNSYQTIDDGSYLISSYIPIKAPANAYYYDSTGETRIFDHWIYNSMNYSPGDYFVGSTGISADTTVTFTASYIKKYNINSTNLDLSSNSHTNTLTWNELYAADDNTEKAAWYKVIGIDSNNNEVVLSDISPYTNGFIPASAAANGQISLTSSLFTYSNANSVKIIAYNSDKTLYNSYTQTLDWYELRFNQTNYGQNLSQSSIWRLQGEKIGALPTIESTRNDWAFDGWEVRTYSQYSGITTHTDIDENTILSSISIYSSSYPYRSAHPKWVEVSVPEPQNIYGAQWDGSSSTEWTRTDLASNFSNPVPYVAGMTAAQCSSPFDNISPWKDMVVTERSGGTMVAIPKFWYKITSYNSTGLKIQITDNYVSGFNVCPACMDRGDGQGERDVVYVGRYHCATNTYKSETGVKPAGSITKAAFRTNIHNLGANIWQVDFAIRFTIWLLYLVEFANWNSQEQIGYGCGSNTSTPGEMGYTDLMPYHTGTTQNSKDTYGLGTQYRNIEGLWDNVYDFLDGCYGDSNGFNIILNPSNFSDSANGTSIGTPTSGYPSKFSVKEINNTFQCFIATESKGGTAKCTCDNWGFNTTYPQCCAGGNYAAAIAANGLFRIDGAKTTTTGSGYGSRIMELP